MAATKKSTTKKPAGNKPVWDKKNPVKEHKHLTAAQKQTAKRRAAKAGRPYPNMVDNMAVAKGEGATSKTGKASGKPDSKSVAAKKTTTKKTPAKKTPAKKTATKKTATKSTAAKKPAAKKTTARKTTAKKSGPKTGSTRKAASK